MSCNNKSKIITTSSKNSASGRSSEDSTSSKVTTSSMEKNTSPCFEALRNHGSGRRVSPIDGYTVCSRRLEPYHPGDHYGKRTWDLFNQMNDIEDRLREADARTHINTSAKATKASESASK